MSEPNLSIKWKMEAFPDSQSFRWLCRGLINGGSRCRSFHFDIFFSQQWPLKERSQQQFRFEYFIISYKLFPGFLFWNYTPYDLSRRWYYSCHNYVKEKGIFKANSIPPQKPWSLLMAGKKCIYGETNNHSRTSASVKTINGGKSYEGILVSEGMMV